MQISNSQQNTLIQVVNSYPDQVYGIDSQANCLQYYSNYTFFREEK